MDVDNILISGMGKTGTTGLYGSVRAALADQAIAHNPLFEPVGPVPVRGLVRHRPSEPIVCKAMIEHVESVLDVPVFPTRIMMVRDPRDVVISRLLFRPLTAKTLNRIGVEGIDPFINALERKEDDPRSTSVQELHRLADELEMSGSDWDRLARHLRWVSRVIDEHEFVVLRYEDFVDGHFDDVSDRVGIPITNPRSSGGEWLRHISRSKSYGNWRNWFTAADMDHFREAFRPFLERFGYDADAEPESQPSMSPTTSSEYVRNNVRPRAATVRVRNAPGWAPAHVEDADELTRLTDVAGDGDAIAAYRAAILFDEGRVLERDRGRAIHWAEEAAVRGHRDGLELLVRLLREDDSLASRRSRRLWEQEQGLLDGIDRLVVDRDQTAEQLDRLRDAVPAWLLTLLVTLRRRRLRRS